MIDFLNPMHTSWQVWILTFLCAYIVGLSKSGLKGGTMMVIPALAYMYGGKLSVGILLPFLLMGDGMALLFYSKSSQLKYLLKLLPWALVGIVIAVYIGNNISDRQFKYSIGATIFFCWILLVVNEFRRTKLNPSGVLFGGILGISGGFATMIGNAAGPIFNMYLLTFRLPKESFISTGAWFFILLNSIKVPLHIYSWETMNWQTLHLNLVMMPALVLGAFNGKYIVGLIPDKVYRYLIYTIIFIAACMLFI